MTKIKICGLMTTADIEAVNQAGPDLAGFIFASGRHQISLKTALKLRQKLNPDITSVGVFVNAPVSEMLEVYKSGAISMVQLHGQEDEKIIAALQDHQIPVIKVFQPETKRPTQADYLMIDSGAGNGKLLDWQRLQLTSSKPLIVAGALDIENIQQVIKTIHPDYVDLSRGVETNGQKDPEKIFQIVKLVHQI